MVKVVDSAKCYPRELTVAITVLTGYPAEVLYGSCSFVPQGSCSAGCRQDACRTPVGQCGTPMGLIWDHYGILARCM